MYIFSLMFYQHITLFLCMVTNFKLWINNVEWIRLISVWIIYFIRSFLYIEKHLLSINLFQRIFNLTYDNGLSMIDLEGGHRERDINSLLAACLSNSFSSADCRLKITPYLYLLPIHTPYNIRWQSVLLYITENALKDLFKYNTVAYSM